MFNSASCVSRKSIDATLYENEERNFLEKFEAAVTEFWTDEDALLKKELELAKREKEGAERERETEESVARMLLVVARRNSRNLDVCTGMYLSSLHPNDSVIYS